MPAKSESQQRIMGMALAYKRGKMPHASAKIKEIAKGMSEKQLHDFAATKHEGLPEKKAFATGFVKRAMEYGYSHAQAVELFKEAVTKAEMYDMQSSPGLNALTASNIGVPYNAFKDLRAPHDVPSRLLNISAPSIAAAIGGGALGAGLSNVAGSGIGGTMLNTMLGGAGGALLGGYLGAKNYNEKIKDLLENDERVWENDTGRLRLAVNLL